MTEASLELDRLRQDVSLNQRIYEEFIARFNAAGTGDELAEPDARMISDATPPAHPAWPKSKLVVLIAAAIATGFGLVMCYARELAETGLRHSGDVVRATGYRPLAMVLRYRSRRMTPQDAVIDAPNSAFVESIRYLLAGLVPRSGAAQRGKVIIVASTLPGEGKSTTALSLARAAAADGLRVLLIDGDVRRPVIHKLASIPLGPGLDVLLKGDVQPNAVIVRDPKSSLDIIPGANAGGKHARISRQSPFDRLFERLRGRYDLIFVDSSPLVAVVDAKVMIQHADQVLLLARWRRTARALVRQCIDGIEAAGGRLAGVAVTQVDGRKLQAYEPGEQTYSRKQLEAYYTG
jgi:capsular exopolysaccharide synthesis family protein